MGLILILVSFILGFFRPKRKKSLGSIQVRKVEEPISWNGEIKSVKVSLLVGMR